MENKNLLSIGKIVNTFGIKGAVKIALEKSIEVNDINGIKLLFIENTNNVIIPKQVESISMQKSHLVVYFKEHNHINEVEIFKGKKVKYLNDNDAFSIFYDLTYYSVVYNKQNGKVIETMFNGNHDLVKVLLENEEKAFWVPLVDVYTNNIDDESRIITLKNIEGLK
ncbi:16S rRNA processing protein [Mesoplasma florum L1]|uniref:Ribosome maturation factor RimM n=1 Tax=Mesoplasma florum (strain ATCC 33453 / NBRC 100688 / NCTC 11704 / L1) TaxID=265311 RepID=RIMM_MESFL|nr:ribosome maturation factor RimM [Mesoplasma florum]Q6F0S4.1 RecName: Full=Ribosome maturation factor RimM [Mesoplasma florum L1]AAT75899.1 16S rRNA processing protein [Mesoplasma florum L1]